MIRFYRKFLRHRYPEIMLWGVTIAVWTRFVARTIGLLLSVSPRPTPSMRDHQPQLERNRRYAG